MMALEAITAERQRQISEEGWSPEHDDGHADGELLTAAMCYYDFTTHEDCFGVPMTVGTDSAGYFVMVPIGWPWAPDWWKPRDPVRNLVRAGALMLAEIDRLDRCGLDAGHVEHKLKRVVAALDKLIEQS